MKDEKFMTDLQLGVSFRLTNLIENARFASCFASRENADFWYNLRHGKVATGARCHREVVLRN